jgi:hypothetical protein
MKTRGELRELAGRVLLGDYPDNGCIKDHSGEPADLPEHQENMEMLALTFCMPGLAWLFGQLDKLFEGYPDRDAIIRKLFDSAAKLRGGRNSSERGIMLNVIDSAESVIEEKTAGRLGRILKSVKGLTSQAKEI